MLYVCLKGTIQKMSRFWTKFDPFLSPSHKLSHMANPRMKNMLQATIPPYQLYASYRM